MGVLSPATPRGKGLMIQGLFAAAPHARARKLLLTVQKEVHPFPLPPPPRGPWAPWRWAVNQHRRRPQPRCHCHGCSEEHGCSQEAWAIVTRPVGRLQLSCCKLKFEVSAMLRVQAYQFCSQVHFMLLGGSSNQIQILFTSFTSC